MDQASKDKVTNSQQAKQLETAGVTNFIYAGVTGVSAGVAYNQKLAAERVKDNTHGTAYKDETTVERDIQAASTSTQVNNLNTGTATLSGAFANGDGFPTTGEVEIFYDAQNQPYVIGSVYNQFNQHADAHNQKIYLSDLKNKPSNITYMIGTKDGDKLQFSKSSNPTISGISRDTASKTVKIPEREVGRTETTTQSKTSFNFSAISTILSSLASLFFGIMWGSLIVAGVQTVKGVRNMHKANVMRRDELMNSLLKNKSESIKESACYLNYDSSLTESLSELKRFSRFKI